jgi:CDGSH-type Zn-finger protein
MPRLVKKTAHAPFQVGDKHICMCGLSENQPFCDTSHKKTLKEDESKLYWYENGKAEEIVTETDDCSCGECKEDECCEGKCCKQ